VFLHKNLEAPAVAPVLPVRHGIADAIKKGAAAEIEPANEHAAEMAEVTYLVVAEAKCAEKREHRHHRDDGAHAQPYGNRKQHNLAIGKQDGAGDQYSENGAGRTNRGNVGEAVAKQGRDGFDENVDDPGSHASDEIVFQEAALSPDQL